MSGGFTRVGVYERMNYFLAPMVSNHVPGEVEDLLLTTLLASFMWLISTL